LANPTTNYSFVLPTATDLVTDLPADFDVALQGVDTRLKALNPSTTLGDIEYRSATANTNTRLGIGSTGNVLTVTGGVPVWAAPAGGSAMTLLSTTTLSGASTTISSIDQSYKHLFMLVDGVNIATSAQTLSIKPNNTTTYYVGISGVSGAATTYANTNLITSTAWDFGTNNGKLAYWLYDYANSGTPAPGNKAISFSGVYVPGAQGYFSGGGGVATGTAITSIAFAVGTSFNGGTVRIYGVN
jgi:hypothetical protein